MFWRVQSRLVQLSADGYAALAATAAWACSPSALLCGPTLGLLGAELVEHLCRLLYSSAWDYTVRCWRRSQPHKVASVVNLGDWVWSVKPKGHNLLVRQLSSSDIS